MLPFLVQYGKWVRKGKNECGETPQEAVSVAWMIAHSILELGGGRGG